MNEGDEDGGIERHVVRTFERHIGDYNRYNRAETREDAAGDCVDGHLLEHAIS